MSSHKVISFFPGSGGNRFFLNLENDPGWNNDLIDYDLYPSYTKDYVDNFEKTERHYKYSDHLDVNITKEYFLTHIMNYDLLKSIFPESIIYKIYTKDLCSSLRRFSRLHNQGLEDIFNTIVWHDEFYSQLKIDNKADILIDIDTDSSYFCKFMVKEFSKENRNFDLVLDFYKKFGKNGPIIDFINSEKK